MLEIIDSNWSKNDSKNLIWKQQQQIESHPFSFFDINRTNYIHPKTQKEYPFYQFKTKDWVGIFALDKEKKLVVIEQYRFGINEVTLEVPGGVADNNDFKQSVIRELEEETGYHCDEPLFLGSLSTNSALMNNYIHFFYAPNAIHEKELNLDETEHIQTKLINVEDFDSLINKGKINHALIVGGFLLFKNKIWKK